jgi:hypothetical protein
MRQRPPAHNRVALVAGGTGLLDTAIGPRHVPGILTDGRRRGQEAAARPAGLAERVSR